MPYFNTPNGYLDPGRSRSRRDGFLGRCSEQRFACGDRAAPGLLLPTLCPAPAAEPYGARVGFRFQCRILKILIMSCLEDITLVSLKMPHIVRNT